MVSEDHLCLPAHDEYALRALAIHAFDYLLKTVRSAAIRQSSGRLRGRDAEKAAGPVRLQAGLRQPAAGDPRLAQSTIVGLKRMAVGP